MSIFFGGSPPITMKRTETSRTCFCLLEDIRNRGRFFLVLGALAVVRASEGLNSVRKGIEEGRACIAPLSHRFRCAFGMVGLTVRFVRTALFLRCPIYRYIRIICILMQIYCIVFIFAYNTRYALIRIKYKYFRCIQLYSRIYLQ